MGEGTAFPTVRFTLRLAIQVRGSFCATRMGLSALGPTVNGQIKSGVRGVSLSGDGLSLSALGSTVNGQMMSGVRGVSLSGDGMRLSALGPTVNGHIMVSGVSGGRRNGFPFGNGTSGKFASACHNLPACGGNKS